MSEMFVYSKFEQNLFKWIDRLNENVNLNNFNKDSNHEKKYGTINNQKEFIEKQLTPQIWLKQYKKSSDREKFELLKLLKNRDNEFIKRLNLLLKKENVTIDI